MENYIIVGIVIIAVTIGVCWTIKHFARRGGCYGSSGYRRRKKKLSSVYEQKEFLISGIHCRHCKDRVEETVNHMKGIRGQVDQKAGKLTVEFSGPPDLPQLKSRLAKIGYSITEIK